MGRSEPKREPKGQTLTKIINPKGTRNRKPKVLRVCITLATMRNTVKNSNTRGRKDIAEFPAACRILNVIHRLVDCATKKIERLKQHADHLCTAYTQFSEAIEKLKNEYKEATAMWIEMICQYKAVPTCPALKPLVPDIKEWRVPLVGGIPDEPGVSHQDDDLVFSETTDIQDDHILFAKGENMLNDIRLCQGDAATLKASFLIAKDGIAQAVLAIKALSHLRKVAGGDPENKTPPRILFEKLENHIPGILKETEAATREFEAMQRRYDFLESHVSEIVTNHMQNSKLWTTAVCQKINISPMRKFRIDWRGVNNAATGSLVLKSAFKLAPSPICGFKPPPRDGRTPSQIAISVVANAGRVSKKTTQTSL